LSVTVAATCGAVLATPVAQYKAGMARELSPQPQHQHLGTIYGVRHPPAAAADT
jgi:hypothetical protein